MLNNPGQDAGGPEVTPETAQRPRAGAAMILGQILLVVLAGLYLAGVVWLYIQLPWLALIAAAVALGIVLSGVDSSTRTQPGNR